MQKHKFCFKLTLLLLLLSLHRINAQILPGTLPGSSDEILQVAYLPDSIAVVYRHSRSSALGRSEELRYGYQEVDFGPFSVAGRLSIANGTTPWCVARGKDGDYLLFGQHQYGPFVRIMEVFPSPDGSRIAYQTEDSYFNSFLYLENNLLRKTASYRAVRNVNWSPDSAFLAWILPHGDFSRDLELLHLDDQRGFSIPDVEAFQWFPDGSDVVRISHKADGVHIWTDSEGIGPFMDVRQLMFAPSTETISFIRDYRFIQIGPDSFGPYESLTYLSWDPTGHIFRFIANGHLYEKCFNVFGPPERIDFIGVLYDASGSENSGVLAYSAVQDGIDAFVASIGFREQALFFKGNRIAIKEHFQGFLPSPDGRAIAFIADHFDPAVSQESALLNLFLWRDGVLSTPVRADELGAWSGDSRFISYFRKSGTFERSMVFDGSSVRIGTTTPTGAVVVGAKNTFIQE